MVGEHFDWSSERPPVGGDASQGRHRFLGVQFACCSVYARVYVNRAGTHYVGHCPKCARRVEFRIGPDGSDHRFYTAY